MKNNAIKTGKYSPPPPLDNIPRQNKVAIIAGNAPSLAEIDYSRLPKDFDVFRCNQFFFEDKYYLGKKVKAAIFGSEAIFEQIYNMQILNQNKEYDIETIFIDNTPLPYGKKPQETANFFAKNCFIQKLHNGKYSENIAEYLEYMVLQICYFGMHPTAGAVLCAVAVALGYREIYLAGIDFYQGKGYAFNALQTNILKILPNAKEGLQRQEQVAENAYHKKDADLNTFAFLQEHYNIQLYSICPNSPMSNYFPLAPITHNTFVPELKDPDYTKDILIPNKDVYAFIGYDMPGFISTHDYKQPLKNNIFFRLFKDFVRLPSDIQKYIKGKKLDKTFRQASKENE